MEIEKVDFDSIYFNLFKLHSGIYAAIFRENLSSNAGFFDLGSYSVIFDTIMDPYATEDLIKACKLFTKKEASFVINSHHHWDHLFGNKKFSMKIPIISSSETLLIFHKNFDDNLKRYRRIANEELKRIKKEIKKETNQDKILEMNNDINTYNEILDPNFELRPPDLIIKDSIALEGTENRIQINCIGAAHTPGDIVAYFEKEKICFMGDLLFENPDPSWVEQSIALASITDAKRHRDFLKEYIEKDIEIYVPGHGNLCSKEVLQNNIEFLEKYLIK